jgi:hypothetical protein
MRDADEVDLTQFKNGECKHHHVERKPLFHGYAIYCMDCGKPVTWTQLKESWK